MGMTKEERREYYRDWQAKNKEKVQTYAKEYHKSHYVKKGYLGTNRRGTRPQNEGEVWKEINEWYCISSQGRVWSWKTGKILKHSINKS